MVLKARDKELVIFQDCYIGTIMNAGEMNRLGLATKEEPSIGEDNDEL